LYIGIRLQQQISSIQLLMKGANAMQQYSYQVVYLNGKGEAVGHVEKQCTATNAAEAEADAKDAAAVSLCLYEGAVSFDIC
jgi:hypothetical protein